MMNQTSLFPVNFPKSAYQYGQRSDGEIHGVVLTKPHIVKLILDLAGFTVGKDLLSLKVLEPSCGHGAFLVPIVERLLTTLKHSDSSLRALSGAITAFDIDLDHVNKTKNVLIDTIIRFGHVKSEAKKLVDGWIHEGDFLLAELEPEYDIVVGNPPYIRIEQIAPELQSEYRRRFSSLFDRADLYVAFIEKCLKLLSKNGVLSFICADRWILNRYGAPLRSLVATQFKLKTYVDLHQASPFDSDVIAYPSIFVIGRGKTDTVDVFSLKSGSETECDFVFRSIKGEKIAKSSVGYSNYPSWFSGDEPWTLSSPEQLAILRDLESRHQTLEADGLTKVKIGVATGNDSLYIVSKDEKIEKSRLLPLVMRADLNAGKITNAERFVINTFEEKGGVVDLNDYPKLSAYFEKHESEIKRRHVAKNNASGWFRTIDRVYPEIVSKPKLLIPDIAGSNEVTFDKGEYFPHHNLYYLISDSWDLEVLGGLLSSKVALFFVWAYAVKMRGGYLRFQAQYLRRIRVPNADSLSADLKKEIKQAFRKRDFASLDSLSLKAYGLKKMPSFDFVDTRK